MTDAFVSNSVAHTLGFTLLHFLWQGLVIGLVTALTLTMLRRQAATVRYGIACAGLVAMIAAPIVTWQSLTISAVPLVVLQAPVVAGTLLTGASALAQATRRGAWTTASLDTLLPFVVMAWMTGVGVLALRLIHGWVAVEGLRRRTLTPLPPVWEARVDALAARLDITRLVRTAESSLLDVPTVVGWLRPAILVPASALAALSPSQLEAILAHEMAHIRRLDYLVNLVQRVVETLLFYHPAVWWVSRQITFERELCCDDIAVEVCGDRVAYAHALASLEQLRPSMPALALTATGGPLVIRIRRLLTGTPTGADRSPVWTAVAVVLTLGALFVASGRVTQADIRAVANGAPRTDIYLSAPAAPSKARASVPGRPAVVASAFVRTRTQPQAQASETPLLSQFLVVRGELWSQARRAAAGANVGPYVIAAGDILGVSVLQDVKLFDDVVVLSDGNVKLPIVNSVRAGGLTLEQFRAEVAAKFELGPRYVMVMLKQSQSPRVVIIGQVRKPGEYSFADTLTLPQLVTQAGGLTDLADNAAVVIRASKYAGGGLQVRDTSIAPTMVITIDFADVQKGVKSVELESGDVVYFN